jgi:hypothetical protein
MGRLASPPSRDKVRLNHAADLEARMSEYAHIQRLIAQVEAAENAAIAELVAATQQLVTRVKLDLMPDRHIGWGGDVVPRVERALDAIAAGTRNAETRSKAPSAGCQSGPRRRASPNTDSHTSEHQNDR